MIKEKAALAANPLQMQPDGMSGIAGAWANLG
jgi:hypothetical protein